MKDNKKTVLLVGVFTSFITAFAGSALNLAVPAMGVYFNMGAAAVGWIVTSYMLCVAAFSVPFGKIADSKGRIKVLFLGIALFGITSFACVFMGSAAGIIAMRALQGIGAAMIFATNMPIVISAFPASERGKTIGIVTTGVYVGLAAGPVLGGILNSNFGWKAIFIFAGLVSVIAFAVAGVSLRKAEEEISDEKFDVKGNIIYIIMITGIIYGLTSLSSLKFGWILIILGLVSGVIFVYVELKAINPMIDVRLFAEDRIYSLSNIATLLNYCASYALGYLVSIYMQVGMGMSSQAAGLVLIAQPICMAMLSAKMGKLSDTVSPQKLASLGMGIYAVSIASFIFCRVDTPIWLIVIVLCIAGTGMAVFSSPNTNVIMSRVSPAKFGVANSILSTMRTTGQATGMAIITVIVSSTLGNVSLYDILPEDLIRTMRISFAVFTVLCSAGIFTSLQRNK